MATKSVIGFTQATHDRVRKLWETGDYTQTTLAKAFGMSNGTVCKIVNDRNCQARQCADDFLRDVEPDMEVLAAAEESPNQPYKLNREQVLEIFQAEGSLREIAKRYGVGHLAVRNIKLGLSWKDVTGVGRMDG